VNRRPDSESAERRLCVRGRVSARAVARAQRVQLAASVQASGPAHGAPPVGVWRAHILRNADILAGDFGWDLADFGPIRAISEAKSGLALAPRGFGGRNVKMGKAKLGAFFDFFSLFGRIQTPICTFLPPFYPLCMERRLCVRERVSALPIGPAPCVRRPQTAKMAGKNGGDGECRMSNKEPQNGEG